MEIEELELSEKLVCALKRNGIKTLDDIMDLSFEEFENLRGVGQKAIGEMSWKIIEFASGRMISRRIEWDKKYPQGYDLFELIKKAKQYDKIKKMVSA